jgi:hypothetical protein
MYFINLVLGCDLYRFVPGNIDGTKVVLKEDVNNILKEFHGSAFGGHSGINKTREAINLRYWWPGITEDIKKYVSINQENGGKGLKEISPSFTFNFLD